jgi:rod shape-determining protein MreD
MTLRACRRLFIVGVVLVVVQLGLLEQVTIDGAHPDAFLMFVIAAGLVAGAQHGAVVGFITGLVADLFVVTPFGLSSLCYVLVAFCVGLLGTIPTGRAPRTYQVAVAVLARVAGTLLFAGLLALLGQPHLPRSELVDVVLVVAIGNAVLALPATAVMGWIFQGSGRTPQLAVVEGGALR